jgi:hypothetical protein
MFIYIRKVLSILALLVSVSSVVRAQNHTQTLSVTNSPLTIAADGNYNQVLVRENSASPTAVFSITLAGSSTAINYPAGTQFLFSGSFVSGQSLGTITATTSGPFSFVAVESNGSPSMSVKNTILNGSGGSGTLTTITSGNLSPLFTVNITNPTTTPALAFTLSNASANTVFANCTGSTAAPSFCSLTGAMLPNPSASTLGGVESVATVANNFVTGISTSGIPSLAQPIISNLGGAGAAVTLTEAAAGDVVTFASKEPGVLTAGNVFTNLNSTNNNTSISLLVSNTGTSTGAIPLVVNQLNGSGQSIAIFTHGGAVSSAGVLSGTPGTADFNFEQGGMLAVTGGGGIESVGTGASLALIAGAFGNGSVFLEPQGTGQTTQATAPSATSVGFKIQLAASPTADAFDIFASNGTTELAGINNTGVLSVPGIINITSGHLLISGTAPTISSGFGATTPTIAAQNGTAAFTINVGTGTIASTGVIGLPAANTGWSCQATDITTTSTTVFMTKQTATTASSATLGNFGDTGTAGGWTASDTLSVHCTAY